MNTEVLVVVRDPSLKAISVFFELTDDGSWSVDCPEFDIRMAGTGDTADQNPAVFLARIIAANGFGHSLSNGDS